MNIFERIIAKISNLDSDENMEKKLNKKKDKAERKMRKNKAVIESCNFQLNDIKRKRIMADSSAFLDDEGKPILFYKELYQSPEYYKKRVMRFINFGAINPQFLHVFVYSFEKRNSNFVVNVSNEVWDASDALDFIETTTVLDEHQYEEFKKRAEDSVLNQKDLLVIDDEDEDDSEDLEEETEEDVSEEEVDDKKETTIELTVQN